MERTKHFFLKTRYTPGNTSHEVSQDRLAGRCEAEGNLLLAKPPVGLAGLLERLGLTQNNLVAAQSLAVDDLCASVVLDHVDVIHAAKDDSVDRLLLAPVFLLEEEA